MGTSLRGARICGHFDFVPIVLWGNKFETRDDMIIVRNRDIGKVAVGDREYVFFAGVVK